jgi:hypothetical protein
VREGQTAGRLTLPTVTLQRAQALQFTLAQRADPFQAIAPAPTFHQCQSPAAKGVQYESLRLKSLKLLQSTRRKIQAAAAAAKPFIAVDVDRLDAVLLEETVVALNWSSRIGRLRSFLGNYEVDEVADGETGVAWNQLAIPRAIGMPFVDSPAVRHRSAKSADVCLAIEIVVCGVEREEPFRRIAQVGAIDRCAMFDMHDPAVGPQHLRQ